MVKNRFCAAILLFVFFSQTHSICAPALSISQQSDGRFRLSWPATDTGFRIEEASALGPQPLWQPGADAVLSGTEFELTLQPSGTTRFFRLVQSGDSTTVILQTSPAWGETGVSVNRESIFWFSSPLNSAAASTPGFLYAEHGGRRILSRTEVSSDGQKVSLFYLEDLPANSQVRVTLAGDAISDQAGKAIDGDADGKDGGNYTLLFSTAGTTALPNTAVIGHVYASELGPDGLNRPLENVIITVDGAEETLRAVTDSTGFFRLQPAPVGRFFVHVDGRPALGSDWPHGAYYPFVGKAWEGIAGATNTPAGGTGEIFLPLIQADALQPVSTALPTEITFAPSVIATNPAFSEVKITVPPNSLFSDSGARGGSVGIAPVPPDRLPEPLPAGLNMPIVITIQTDGPQNFDQPVPVRFPNLPDPVTGIKLAPGQKTVLWSFNHDTGRWEPQGTGTVTSDGNYVQSDPGVGVRQPGWHGFAPGSPGSGNGPGNPPCTDGDCDNDGIPDDEEDDQCDKDLYLLIGSIFDCANGVLGSAAGASDPTACGMGAFNGAAAAARDCQLDPAGCDGTIANAFLGTALGCSEWALKGVVGRLHPVTKAVLTGAGLFHGCVLGPGQNYGNYLNCKAAAGRSSLSSQAAPSLAALAEENPFQAQSIMMERARNYFALWFGTTHWLDLPASQSITSSNFFRLLGDAVAAEGPGGSSINDAEESALLALPLPEGITAADAQQVIRRTERISTGTLQPGELDVVALETAATQFVEIMEVFAAKNWNFNDGFRQGLLKLTAQAQNLCRAQSTSGSMGGGGGGGGGGSSGGGGGAVATPGVSPSAPRILKFVLHNLDSGFIQRGEVQSTAELPPLVLAPNSFYGIYFLDEQTLQIAASWFVSAPAGQSTDIPCAIWAKASDVTLADSDSDGLSDIAEFVLGSDGTNADTDADGVPDGVEVTQGLSPLSGEFHPIGPVAGAQAPGYHTGVWAEGDFAYVASGAAGLSVFELKGFDNPVLIAQRDTPGNAHSIAGENGIVAIADGSSGIAVFDVRNAANPLLLQQIITGADVQAVAVHRGVIYAATLNGVALYETATGRLIETVPGITRAQDIQVSGDKIYVVTDSELVIARDVGGLFAVSGRVPVSGSAAVLELGRKLFVGGNYAYIGTFDGFRVVDISNPSAPTLAVVPQGVQASSHDQALNGAGLLVSVSSFSGEQSLATSLYDVSNPTVQPVFLTSTEPALERALHLHRGLALVVGRSGLRVVNYLNPETGAIPPVISLSPLFPNDPLRTEANVTYSVIANATDDRQVREVELYLDDRLVSVDASYPFELPFTSPTNSPAKTNYVLRAKATDMSGRSTWSDSLLVSLVADASPPRIVALEPLPNSVLVPNLFRTVAVTFDDTIASFPGNALTLYAAGADNLTGTPDDQLVSASSAGLDPSGHFLSIETAAPLAPGLYQARLNSGVSNSSGNARMDPVAWDFRVGTARASIVRFTPPESYTELGSVIRELTATVDASFPQQFENSVQFRLVEAGVDRVLGNASDVTIATSATFNPETRTFVITPEQPLAAGIYRITASGTPINTRSHDFTFRTVENLWAHDFDGRWSIASNWTSGAIIPNDILVIDRPNAELTTTLQNSLKIRTVTSREAVLFDSATLTLSGLSEFHAPATTTASSLQFIGGTSRWHSVLSPQRTLTLNSHRLELASGGEVILREQSLSLQGTSSTFAIDPGGRLILNQTNAALSTSGAFAPGNSVNPLVENRGEILKVGAGQWRFDLPFLNLGLLSIDDGLVRLGDDSANFGTIAVPAPGVLDVNYFTNAASGRILGNGRVVIRGLSSFPGDYEFAGTTEIPDGNNIASFAGTVRNAGAWLVEGTAAFHGLATELTGSVTLSGGSLILNSPGETLLPNLRFASHSSPSIIDGSSSLVFRDPFTNATSLLIRDQVRARFEQPVHVAANLSVETTGGGEFLQDIFWTGGSFGGNILMASNVVLHAIHAETNFARSLSLQTNFGTIRKSGPGVVNVSAGGSTGFLENRGTVEILEGSMVLNVLAAQRRYIQVEGARTHVVGRLSASGYRMNGGVLSGRGLISTASTTQNLGRCLLSCAVSPGDELPGNVYGILSFDGQAGPEWQAAGRATLDIGGTNPGVDHDQVISTRTMNLGGVLEIRLAPGYLPNLGETITIMTGPRTGTFSEVTGHLIGADRQFRVVYEDSAVKLVVEVAR